MAETDLELARRQVAAGRERIARLRELLPDLVAGDHHRALLRARRLLATMLETQRLAEEHLARLEREAN